MITNSNAATLPQIRIFFFCFIRLFKCDSRGINIIVLSVPWSIWSSLWSTICITLTMSQAFVRENDEQWLHEVQPTIHALTVYLTRENNGIRVYETKSIVKD